MITLKIEITDEDGKVNEMVFMAKQLSFNEDLNIQHLGEGVSVYGTTQYAMTWEGLRIPSVASSEAPEDPDALPG